MFWKRGFFKDKKGALERLAEYLIVLGILALMVIAYIYLSKKGFSGLDVIKRLLRLPTG